MTKFKSWGDWHRALRARMDEMGIKGTPMGGVNDSYFFIFDRDRPILWTYDQYGNLEKWHKALVSDREADSQEKTHKMALHSLRNKLNIRNFRKQR